MKSNFSGHLSGQGFMRGEKNGACHFIMFRLGKEISSDVRGICRCVSYDKNLAGAGGHVNAAPAPLVNHHLGGRYIGIAGADDLIHSWYQFRAVCKSGYGLGASYLEYTRDAAELAAAIIKGFTFPSFAGVTRMISGTPAIFAGTAAMITVEGYEARPPGA